MNGIVTDIVIVIVTNYDEEIVGGQTESSFPPAIKIMFPHQKQLLNDNIIISWNLSTIWFHQEKTLPHIFTYNSLQRVNCNLGHPNLAKDNFSHALTSWRFKYSKIRDPELKFVIALILSGKRFLTNQSMVILESFC